ECRRACRGLRRGFIRSPSEGLMKRVISSIVVAAVAGSLFAASSPILIDVAREHVGRPSARFLSVVGDWVVAKDERGKPVLQVDGRQWIKGQPSAGLAAKARTIYGSKHEE